ncbi:MAG: hypothetical protein OXC14_02925 [Rhodospirillaceae bacterium]|nr:hypothetical protein [Rhodospirillaceae bacterium]
MMNHDGVFIGQVCHIEAAEARGPRFNPEMTNEERRAASNLLLMCYEHHQVTNDEGTYTTQRLTEIKQEHECRFSAAHLAILQRLTDWTTTNEPQFVGNLSRMNEVLEWHLSDDDLQDAVTEINALVEKLRNIPIDARAFIGALANRLQLMQDSDAVHDNTDLLASDFQDAHGITGTTLSERVAQMAAYGVGGYVEFHSELGVYDGISLYELPSGWPVWIDIAAFCKKTATPIEHFVEDVDFSSLDFP